ncbi:MAG: heme peroxidase, partial [Methylibium sp.]|uniref:peroxidase family protein n=1 Tax=Methylibium sp. TaxID=2067992 RepID=UPI00181241F5
MNINLADLEFILEQIKTGEAHAAGTPQSIRTLVGDPLLPFGVRTVDGSYNNLVAGRENWGAADQLFPLLTKQHFLPGEAVSLFDPDGPGPQAIGTATNYWQTSGSVFDSQPRVISNLIATQTEENPAAVSAWNPADLKELDGDTLVMPNVSPDLGLSSPFNSWFTLFGQFFDHGLDLANKGGGTIFIPLKDDDPLMTGPNGPLPPNQAFMPLTRLSNTQVLPGPDGQVGTADDIHRHTNQTTPHVDQNQTYTSHPSHQVFLREYELNAAGDPVATGHMLDGAGGGLATWADIKQQAREMLGIALTDADVLNVPQVVTDEYGRFARGPNGYAQLVTTEGVIEGNPAAPISTVNALRTNHAFLDDIAHTANPADNRGALKTADGDTGINAANEPPLAGQYDNELLEAHYITGDGRGNENIGLTTVHHVFHAEHNRLVEQIKADLLATNDPTLLAEWQLSPTTETSPAVWNGERLFQAARFGNEMQYQHLVFEEFARKIQPQVDIFAGYDVTINPAITAEFAHTVYRFGHSMLTGEVDRVNDAGVSSDLTLIQAFLNPVEFANSGIDSIDAAEAIVRGMTRQTGNAIDEFVAEGVRSNLVGLPLDLGAINIARGRDAGVPSLNVARKQFFDATTDSALAPYTSWNDFQTGIKHPASLVNFIAAYGTHASIIGATTMEAKRAAAQTLVFDGKASNGTDGNTDAYDFLNARGDLYGGGSLGGLNNVDFWIGGLAEKTAPFGGMLGSSFNFVFETQMEKLQDGDRMYYLARTAGQNFLVELENNTFSDIVMRNLPGVKHLPADIFIVPDQSFELDDPSTWTAGVTSDGVNLRYVGGEHVVIGGTDANNDLRADEGDDTVYGDGGNDRIEGGAGNDSLVGGDGDDIITDSFGDDNIKGGTGDDAINAGLGADLVIAGPGGDFVVAAGGLQETFAGAGNDFVRGGTSTDTIFGGEGHDWIEGGGSADLLQGDNGDPFQASKVRGNDVIKGDGGNDDYDSESGDDIMVSGSGVERFEGMLGFDWVTHYLEPNAADADLLFDVLPPNVPIPPAEANADRFDSVEGISGWNLDDTLRGDDRVSADLTTLDVTTGFNNALNDAPQISLIDGLGALLGGPGVTSFSGGNIMLGGGGSDFIEGRAGDDLLNGDAWLRVQLEHGGLRYDSMSQLQAGVFARTILPRDISIVREIVFASGAAAGDDRLDGGLGNDTLNAGEGQNVVIGGAGDDRIDVSAGNDTIVLATGFGADTVTGFDAEGDSATTQDLIDVSSYTGADDITAANFAERVTIEALGADTLVTIDGDTVTLQGVAAAGIGVADFILEGPPAPEPPPPPPTTVESSTSYGLLADDPPNLTLTGTGNITGVGDARDNILTGNSGNNQLHGLAGSDELIDNAGNDLLNGGTGVDIMSGGVGNDTYVIDNIADVVNELANEGTDTIQSTITVESLVTNIENLTLTGTASIDGTGNAGDNVITGNSGVNVLRGGIGNDTLNGAGGNDTLIGGGGNDTLNVTTGNDTIEFLAAGFGADTVVGFDAVSETAGAQDRIDVRGFTGADDITVDNFGDRVVIGADGADTLVTIGVDTIRLTGVAAATVNGADFLVDGGSIPEPPSGTVESSESRVLAEGEGPDLTLTGTGNIDGTGNSAANVITGNSGNNLLAGLGGADTFALVNGGNDTIVLGAGSGADLVTGFDAEGGTDLQDLIDLRGFADITTTNFATSVTFSPTGTGSADTLVTIAGGSTVTLAGIAQANVSITDFIVNAGVIDPPPPPLNPVESDTTRTLAEDEGPDLTLTGTANINGTGNSVANIITGNVGNNVLTGLGGADTFALVNGGNDTIVLGAGSGADLVTGFDAEGGTDLQ